MENIEMKLEKTEGTGKQLWMILDPIITLELNGQFVCIPLDHQLGKLAISLSLT